MREPPGMMKAVAGVTVADLSVAEVTFSALEPWIEPRAAELLTLTVFDPAD